MKPNAARGRGLRNEVRRLQHRFADLHGAVELLGIELILYVKMLIATFLLEKGNQKGCQELLEEGKTTLDGMVDVDPSVHGTYYWVCSQYYKAHQDDSEFYKSALLYVAYAAVESLSEPFKQVPAYYILIPQDWVYFYSF
jgi:26S proteasome regulatory subunit N9